MNQDLKTAIQALRAVLEEGEFTFSSKIESALVDVERAASLQTSKIERLELENVHLRDAATPLWANLPLGMK